MKKLFAILCMSLVAGCATRPFDPVEYNYAISSSILSTRAMHQCVEKTPTYREFVKELNTHSMQLFEYEKHHSENEQILVGVTNLRQLVIEFSQAEASASETYCVHKLSEIQSTSRALAKTLSRMQIDLCKSDALERLELYKKSFESGKLSKAEYEELVKDLPRLVRSDNAYCTAEQKEALLMTINAISSVIGALK